MRVVFNGFQDELSMVRQQGAFERRSMRWAGIAGWFPDFTRYADCLIVNK